MRISWMWLPALLGLGACLQSNPAPRCVPNAQVECACPLGVLGTQRCLDNGRFEACQCPDDSAGAGGAGVGGIGGLGGSGGHAGFSGSAGIGGNAGFSGGGGLGGLGGLGGSGATAGSSGTGGMPSAPALLEGNEELLGLHSTTRGVVIVLVDRVLLIDIDGIELARWTAPRPLMASALEDGMLAVADGAILTTLDADDLTEIGSGTLVESCADVVIVSGARVVCGPSNDWDRVFYTYDGLTGDLLASSTTYTYNGIPMRRVPGHDRFVTVTVGTSPADFHLYEMGTDDAAVYIGESPYHGDFAANDTYAFNMDPATHVVTHEGLLLSMNDAECVMGVNSFNSGCFLKDGALGTLTGSQRFAAMSNVAGTLYGLIDPSPSYTSGPCGEGCLLQSIDVANRLVVTQRVLHLDVGGIVAVAYHAPSDKVVIGAFEGGPYPYDDVTGYQVIATELTE